MDEYMVRFTKEVEPKLDKNSIEFFKNLKNQKGKVTKTSLQEFIKYWTQNKEIFSSYVTFTDVFHRKSSIFKRITQLFLKARKEDKQYLSYYNEIIKEESELWWINRGHSNWVRKNSDKVFEILDMVEERCYYNRRTN